MNKRCSGRPSGRHCTEARFEHLDSQGALARSPVPNRVHEGEQFVEPRIAQRGDGQRSLALVRSDPSVIRAAR